MNSPLVSIVIANYNYGRFLEDAIQSVISQNCNELIELIICDAGSNDNSIEIIQKYAAGLPPNKERRDCDDLVTDCPATKSIISWWCSEADGGQSAAFNKGFSHARGRFLTWLNADDILLPGVIEKLRCAVQKYPNCEWFAGGCVHVDPKLNVFKCVRVRTMSRYRAFHGILNVCGPSSFFSRRLYALSGGIDERFQYSMDIDLWLRFYFVAGVSYMPFCTYAWALRLHPDAKMSGHKFLPNGQILDGAQSSKAYYKDLRRVEQLNNERRWTNETLGGRILPMNRIGGIFSAKFVSILLSKLDTLRFRGRPISRIS